MDSWIHVDKDRRPLSQMAKGNGQPSTPHFDDTNITEFLHR